MFFDKVTGFCVLALSFSLSSWAQTPERAQRLLGYITQANTWVLVALDGGYGGFPLNLPYREKPRDMVEALHVSFICPNEPFTDIIPGIYAQLADGIAAHKRTIPFQEMRAFLKAQEVQLGQMPRGHASLQPLASEFQEALKRLSSETQDKLDQEEIAYTKNTKNSKIFGPAQPLAYTTVGGLRAFIVFGSLPYSFTDLILIDLDACVCAHNALEALLLAISTSPEDYRALHFDAPVAEWEKRLQSYGITVEGEILKRLYAFQRQSLISNTKTVNLAELFFNEDTEGLWRKVRYSFREGPWQRLHDAACEGRIHIMQEEIGQSTPRLFAALKKTYRERGVRLGLLDLTNVFSLMPFFSSNNSSEGGEPLFSDFLGVADERSLFAFVHALLSLSFEDAYNNRPEPIVLPTAVLIGTQQHHDSAAPGVKLFWPLALPLASLLLVDHEPSPGELYALPQERDKPIAQLIEHLGQGVQPRFTWLDGDYPRHFHQFKALNSRQEKMEAVEERAMTAHPSLAARIAMRRERAHLAWVAYQQIQSSLSTSSASLRASSSFTDSSAPSNATTAAEAAKAKAECERLFAKLKSIDPSVKDMDEDMEAYIGVHGVAGFDVLSKSPDSYAQFQAFQASRRGTASSSSSASSAQAASSRKKQESQPRRTQLRPDVDRLRALAAALGPDFRQRDNNLEAMLQAHRAGDAPLSFSQFAQLLNANVPGGWGGGSE